jgi:hypothetical protein
MIKEQLPMITAEQDVEAYKEVLDILASRLKKTDELNAQLRESIFESQRKIAVLEDALTEAKKLDDLPDHNP